MTTSKPKTERPRLLIEDWIPAAAIGVECMRERGSSSALAPHTYLHVWWARRPLTVSRAAVLASLLPANFPRDIFERLLGFGKSGTELAQLRELMDEGVRVPEGFGCERAFKRNLREDDLERAYTAIKKQFGENFTVIDPMAGGGSIPLEATRLGFRTLANEYNPVACSVLEATIDYPFRFGPELVKTTDKWGQMWLEKSRGRLLRFFPKKSNGLVHAYVFARTVPCPDTQFHTPLVTDWHLIKTKGADYRVVAEPVVDKSDGTWSARIREIGSGAGKLREPPKPTYVGGKGISLFTGHQIAPAYIQAKAQNGEMLSTLYAVAVKTPTGLDFAPPDSADLQAISPAESAFGAIRSEWEKGNVIPTEDLSEISNYDRGHRLYGMYRWADMFSPRQLLSLGILVDELRSLRREILEAEGRELGEAVVHLLAIAIDKYVNFNCCMSSWASNTLRIRAKFDRHNYSFKSTWAELASFGANESVKWCLENILKAERELQELYRPPKVFLPSITQGSATNLPDLETGSIAAVVVDPPYADNVQYAELADFFYVWLKRTQGYRRPEWFSTRLCSHDEEAVVNPAQHKMAGGKKFAVEKAGAFYQRQMAATFREAHRILRDDGVLTVMFTHKKQEAWEALFMSLIQAGFTITATWPVKTESEHSLHQAQKNAAQSTVILVARKRPPGAGIGYFDKEMVGEIRAKARVAAERLKGEGLNAVDQLVGSFGPAMEVYSRHDEVRTDTGEAVGVSKAIDEASEAVSTWRIEQLAELGLEGVESEGKFVLLCWDVLGAAEFRFNEANLLGKAVGMEVDTLIAAGLVTKSGDKIKMVPAKERRRERALEPDEVVQTLFGPEAAVQRRRRKGDVLRIHPNDPQFRTALDACHALALRYLEAGGGAGGIGNARALMRQQNWTKTSSVAKLMDALVHAAPEALRHEHGKKSAAALFPEFRAWHALLLALFDVPVPEWKEKLVPQMELTGMAAAEEEEEAEDKEGEDDGEV